MIFEEDRQATEHPDPPEPNPSESELEVEGPNESAPGHEPASPSATPGSHSREGQA